MRNLCFRFATLLSGVFAFYACSQEPPTITRGLNEIYYLPRMKPYTFESIIKGEVCRWSMKTESGIDSLLSTEPTCLFLQVQEGTYYLKYEILDSSNPHRQEFQVIIFHEEVEYSPYISKVYEYRPAPGQFVNELPQYEEGDRQDDMNRKAEMSLSGTLGEEVTLGGYGGYITFGFDHTVVNVKGKKDFMIMGNAFYETNGSTVFGASSEPGIVMVAFDKNQNGIPDPEEWYELAGSEHGKPTTIQNYEITYLRPDPNKVLVPGIGMIDAEHISWSDNQGIKGFIPKNISHSQDYYPKWIPEERLVFSGTLLPPNAVLQSGTYVLYPYEWGYADNYPNENKELNCFDIDWAIDKEGNPVTLPGVDFIRVYTGLNQYCQVIGETSTEITGAQDLHVKGLE